jgi:hypothetical protein
VLHSIGIHPGVLISPTPSIAPNAFTQQAAEEKYVAGRFVGL